MVDVKLLHFVKDGIKKGYAHSELKKILIENGWTNLEIEETLSSLKKQELKNPQPRPIQKANILALNKFIKSSLQRGARKHEIKLALLSKGWDINKIDNAFIRLKEKRLIRPKIKDTGALVGYSANQKKEQTKKEILKKEKPILKKKQLVFNKKKIMVAFLGFILITTILTGTISVFYFISGINSHTSDCNSGLCIDTKEYAINYSFDNLLNSLMISAIVAFIITLAYFIIPNNTIIVWVANLSYLAFTLFIAFLWIKFITK
jgi:hypothetical protein